MSKLIKVGITHGDYNGIGYEATLKALADERIPEIFTPVMYGIPELVKKCATQFNLLLPPLNIINKAEDAQSGKLNIVDLHIKPELQPGVPTRASGEAAVAALEAAVADALAGKIDCLVTAPISKEAVQGDNFSFTGHTEFLAERTGTESQMILFADKVRVALLTTHKSIREIPATVTSDAIKDALRKFYNSLCLDFGMEYPRIAVLGLNPHCGDGGLLGREEIEVIIPTLKEMESEMLTFGPFAADGFFAFGNSEKYDGILAMYHDQGLAPFKALAGSGGVNFTAGLPFVRTSPDHGTGYDIAWQGYADPTSMRFAMYSAVDMTRTRRRNLAAAAHPLMNSMPEKSERKSEKHTDKNAIQ